MRRGDEEVFCQMDSIFPLPRPSLRVPLTAIKDKSDCKQIEKVIKSEVRN